MNEKKPIYYSTSFFPTLFAGIMALLIILQFFLGVIADGVLSEEITSKFFIKLVNSNFQLPMQEFAYSWVAISAAYIGVDRASYFVKSTTESKGSAEFGDPSTNRRVILLSGLLFGLALICNLYVDKDFQLTSLATSFGSSITLYCAGQKSIKIAKYIES